MQREPSECAWTDPLALQIRPSPALADCAVLVHRPAPIKDVAGFVSKPHSLYLADILPGGGSSAIAGCGSSERILRFVRSTI